MRVSGGAEYLVWRVRSIPIVRARMRCAMRTARPPGEVLLESHLDFRVREDVFDHAPG